MIKSFPKIFHLGDKYTQNIFNEDVEITEKIDGSQFDFGKINGELFIRSKGSKIIEGNIPKMFQKGVDYVISIVDKIPDNTIFYGEYLSKPKANVLAYDRVPKNNIILFGVSDEQDNFISKYDELRKFADLIDIETVPLLYSGKIEKIEELHKLLETISILGGQKIEGFVVKNYTQSYVFGNMIIPILSGKFVSEEFKEVHAHDWKKENTGRGKFDLFKQGFRSDARWNKAIQHLKEKNELDNSPRDIGNLLKEIKKDIIEEEKENIKDFLWREFSDEILRYSINGFPEYYKAKLLESNFKSI
jgi:hypothetical protein